MRQNTVNDGDLDPDFDFDLNCNKVHCYVDCNCNNNNQELYISTDFDSKGVFEYNYVNDTNNNNMD